MVAKNNNEEVIVIVPSLNPDEKLLVVVNALIESGFDHIIVVDDGSEDMHKAPFTTINKYNQCTLITHELNMGKGRALKTAFSYINKNYSNILGIITIDGDNQHDIKDIIRCKEELIQCPNHIVLGCRDFSSENVPPKNKFGNKLTSFVFKFACGLNISDTQTGLRGIPLSLLKQFCEVEGERYEYETNMLLHMKEMNIPFKEVKIQTIYIDNNKTSHFNPVKDSIKVYLVILKFLLSSLSSSLIDLITFAILIFAIGNKMEQFARILVATVVARVLSSLFNFFCNRNAVFKSKVSLKSCFTKYYILCISQMIVSYGCVYALSLLFRANNIVEIIVKVFVDVLLFLISFQIQRRWVFVNRN